MAAIDAGPRRQRGLFGLLCGTISIRKSILCIGDNSIAENDPTDRSGDNRQQPDIENPHPSVDDPSTDVKIPSPVLVSKKLAEEAVAKRRNVRFRHQATVIEEEEEHGFENSSTVEANQKLLNEHSNNITATDAKCNRRIRQKKMAPAPPLPGILGNAS
ncbi:hypothetical protein DAPPUDRAFT_319200 [Daphnia pulex]|uniref:Uncharacterized protein n=1 Tax=Daphnia pulex TaxID=6669 RepID=E9GKZ8_DAPPU|nr:hypothetical protein DAPPUDRAFT_319200 [Daphnia pulex]|eukprot:EFX79767.1 hypothetical protein DAPPUDRAFT_319200 [Daphnia pulex]